MVIVLSVLFAVLALLYVRLYLRYRRNIRKVSFVFDAMDNDDFSFHFVDNGDSAVDTLLNRSLNRIARVVNHARDEAMEREKYYESIMDAAGTGIIVVDGKGHILQHNAAALRLSHRTALTHICQIGRVFDEGGLSRRDTFTMLRGERVRIVALDDIGHELMGREVDSWIKLIRVMTHEIMNAVTPITSLSATLLPTATGEQREGLETINHTCRELLDFVENYRSLTHLPQPHPKTFYVAPFLKRMVRLTGRGIGIDVRPADLLMYADEGLMSRVVTNILKNACEAVDEAVAADDGKPGQGRVPKVWINAYANDDDAVVIDISNDASLIDDEVAAHIFVPFFTTKSGGSGIGLSLSQQIMHMSGGMLRLVQDRAAGIVTFRIVD